MSARIVYLAPDLMTSLPVEEAARRANLETVAVNDVNALPEALSGDGVRLLIVDLAVADVNPEAVARAAQGAGVPVVAFGPHVDVALRKAALAAGIEHVYPRSKFLRELGEIVNSYAE